MDGIVRGQIDDAAAAQCGGVGDGTDARWRQFGQRGAFAEWHHDGLAVPASVLKRSAAYFENQDIMGQWINERCEAGDSTLRALYTSYRAYCESCHEFALRQGEFKDSLLNRPGIRRARMATLFKPRSYFGEALGAAVATGETFAPDSGTGEAVDEP